MLCDFLNLVNYKKMSSSQVMMLYIYSQAKHFGLKKIELKSRNDALHLSSNFNNKALYVQHASFNPKSNSNAYLSDVTFQMG
jgi:hypothetical protein